MTTVTMFSGRDINLLSPARHQIVIDEIALGLSHIRRFNGQTRAGYCVAAHALHVCDLVRQMGGTLSAQRAALHHDSHEYLLGDISTPVKQMIDLHCQGQLTVVEQMLQRAVLDALCLRTAYVSSLRIIRHADLIALATERRDLQAEGDVWGCLDGIDPDPQVDCHQRALLPDDQWAEQFAERDHDLRARMAELAEYPPRGTP